MAPMTVAELEAHVVEERQRRSVTEKQQAAAQEAYDKAMKENEHWRRIWSIANGAVPAEGETPVTFQTANSCLGNKLRRGMLADRSSTLAAIVLHPWGMMGGSMNDPHVVHICDTLGRRGGLTTLRFNFRRSLCSWLGRNYPAAEEVRAAWRFLRSLDSPPTRLLLVGYSYGSLVAADVAPSLGDDLSSVVLVSPPLGYERQLYAGREVIPPLQRGLRAPALFLVGAHDSFCPEEQFVKMSEGFSDAERSVTSVVVRDHSGSHLEGCCSHGGCSKEAKVLHHNIYKYLDRHIVPWLYSTYGLPLDTLHKSDGEPAEPAGSQPEEVC